MFAFLLTIWSLLTLINGQSKVGYATEDDVGGSDLSVDVTIQIKEDGEAEISLCGPADTWYGVAFDDVEVKMTTGTAYAIIVTSDTGESGGSVTATEYILDDGYAPGTMQSSSTITLAEYSFKNGDLCVELTRSAIDSDAGYDFPTSFDTNVEVFMAVAQASSGLVYQKSGGMTNQEQKTLTFRAGEVPSGEPTTTDDSDGSETVTSTSETKSAVCWSSDSWVITYPDYERKMVKDLKVGDLMLTYDELNDKFIWDELLVKLHFEDGEYLNDVQVEMREFILNNGERLSMTDNHLIYIGHAGLHRADKVKIGDKLKLFNGEYVDVIGINENILKYPRNMITYNGNLVINGIAISTFTDTIWGESENWGKSLRMIMKYGYSYNIWRYPAWTLSHLWTNYASNGFKEYVLQYYVNVEQQDDKDKSYWFSSIFSSS